MRTISKIFLLTCCCASLHTDAQRNKTESLITPGTPDHSCCTNGGCCKNSMTPQGITTDHIHPKGDWMLSYGYMNMIMQGNRIGTSTASDDMVYKNYMMAPEKMVMQMHMVMLMYGITDRLTVMAMGGLLSGNMSMNMQAMVMPGMTMPMSNMKSTSSGFTDATITGLYSLQAKGNKRIIASMGIGLPAGTIRATGTTMLGDNQRLPYDMQPGTGSFCIAPGITYVKAYRKFEAGANAGASIRLNYNDLGYKTGNVYHVSAWGSYQLLPFLSCSLRGEGLMTEMIHGKDAAIDIPVYLQNDPTTRPENYGGTTVIIYAGLNLHLNQRVLDKFSLLAEYGIPAYENLNGTQMSLHATLLAGLQYSF